METPHLDFAELRPCSSTPFTYGAGYAAYALATGLSFASFIALILEVLGHGRRAAATGFSLLGSSGNLSLAYMTWLDGAGYKRGGARGLMGTDAVANVAGGVLLLLIARYCARRWKPRRSCRRKFRLPFSIPYAGASFYCV
jgi:hypothetical protein